MKTLMIALFLFTGIAFAQEVKSLSIVSGTYTESLQIGNKEILAIHDVDSTFAGTTITLYASSTEDGKYQPVNYDGVIQTYNVTKGFYFVPDPSAVASILNLRILSDATETTTYNIVVGDVIGD